MRSLLIDPFTRSVSLVTTSGTDPDLVRSILECRTFAIDVLDEVNHIIYPLGLEEQPGMRWWAFNGAAVPQAGRALIRGNAPDGLRSADCTIDQLLLEQRVTFPDIEFDGWQQVPKFRPLPAEEASRAPLPQPVAEQPQEEPASDPWTLWTVVEDVDVGFRATLVTIDAQGKAKRGTSLENDDLEELRAMLPPGLRKVERTPTDHASIVESWTSKPSN